MQSSDEGRKSVVHLIFTGEGDEAVGGSNVDAAKLKTIRHPMSLADFDPKKDQQIWKQDAAGMPQVLTLYCGHAAGTSDFLLLHQQDQCFMPFIATSATDSQQCMTRLQISGLSRRISILVFGPGNQHEDAPRHENPMSSGVFLIASAPPSRDESI